MFIPELARIMTDFLVPDATGMNDFDLAKSDFVELHELIKDAHDGMIGACLTGNMALVEKMANRGTLAKKYRPCWNYYLTLVCEKGFIDLGRYFIAKGAVECYRCTCGPTCRTFGRLQGPS